MNESDTRLKKIDPALRKQGWLEVEGSDILTEERAYQIAPDGTISDAKAGLGSIGEINKVFVGFQKELYAA